MSHMNSPHDSGITEGHLPRQRFNLWTWARAQVDKASYRPRPAPGMVVRRLAEDGAPYYVLKNPGLGTYLKLSEQDYVHQAPQDVILDSEPT